MGQPSFVVGRLFVGEDTSVGGGKRGTIEIQSAMDLGIGRKGRIDARAAQKIERELGLFNESIPEVEGKVLVNAAEAGDKCFCMV
jgi:hypothetical protein